MKTKVGLLVTFLLLGAISSVVPVLGPMFAATIGSYYLLKKENFSGMFNTYLAFMIGTGLVTWLLFVSEESKSPGAGLLGLCIIIFIGFWSGFVMSRD